MTKNSLLHAVYELHFDRYDPRDAAEALKVTEKLAWERINKILSVSFKERNFKNTVSAFSDATEEFGSVCSIISHHESVLGEPWRKADLLATKIASRLYSELGLHEGIYKALKEVRQNLKTSDLSKAQNKLLDDIIRDYKRGGIELPLMQKKRLKEIKMELSRLSTKFSQNVVKANDKTGIYLKNEEDLLGLSDELIADAKTAAKEKKLPGYWIAYSEPSYLAVMSQCAARATRKAMYKAAKISGLKPNLPLVKSILALRYEKSKLLGYKNFADYALEDRMAKDGQTARNFINKLINIYRPIVIKESAALELFAKDYEKNPEFLLEMSDLDTGQDWYYAQKYKERLFNIDQSEIRNYFPISKVLEGMFETLSTLYGVKFLKNTKLTRWHMDVEVYDIKDEAGKHIATVWCDWFARKNKQGGAWMNSYYVADRKNGKVEKPHLGYVIASLMPPTKTKPSLLNTREVETIWHEFGHFMHLALGRTELSEQSMHDIEWDFVEAPSQIFENWVWQPQIIDKITEHYISGEKLPKKIVSNFLSARQFMVASKAARQFYLSETDLELHIDYAKDPRKADPLVVSRRIKTEAFGHPAEKWDIGILNFSHIFSGGYASAYYSYKWAEAIEADFFEKFEKEGVLNPKVGREYRDKVLAKGSEVPATELVKSFLGRESTIDAMLRRDGIKT